MNLGWDLVRIDLDGGEQRGPAFLAVNPNGEVPVLLDQTVFESGAILLHLARRTGEFEPSPETLSWPFWQVAAYGPMLGQAGHFRGRFARGRR